MRTETSKSEATRAAPAVPTKTNQVATPVPASAEGPSQAKRIAFLTSLNGLAGRVASSTRDARGGRKLPRVTGSRAAVATLVAVSATGLAACGGQGDDYTYYGVGPAQEEVKKGLPTAPGKYEVAPDGIARNPNGVYSVLYTNAAGQQQQMSTSLLRFQQGTKTFLEMPKSGDPILHLTPNTVIPIYGPDMVDGETKFKKGKKKAHHHDEHFSGFIYPWYMWTPYYGSTPSKSTAKIAKPSYLTPNTAAPMSPRGATTIMGATSHATPPPMQSRVMGDIARRGTFKAGKSGGKGKGTSASSKAAAAKSGFSTNTAAARSASARAAVA